MRNEKYLTFCWLDSLLEEGYLDHKFQVYKRYQIVRNYNQQLSWNLESELDSMHANCWGWEQFVDYQNELWVTSRELMDSWWRSFWRLRSRWWRMKMNTSAPFFLVFEFFASLKLSLILWRISFAVRWPMTWTIQVI